MTPFLNKRVQERVNDHCWGEGVRGRGMHQAEVGQGFAQRLRGVASEHWTMTSPQVDCLVHRVSTLTSTGHSKVQPSCSVPLPELTGTATSKADSAVPHSLSIFPEQKPSLISAGACEDFLKSSSSWRLRFLDHSWPSSQLYSHTAPY